MKKFKINYILPTLALATALTAFSCTFDYGVDKPEEIVETEIPPVTVPTNHVFTHPGMLHTQEDFDRMKSHVNAGDEPWTSGYQVLANNSHSSSNYTMQGPVVSLIRGGNSTEVPAPDNYSTAFNDAAAAYQTAIRWKITGDDAYAIKGIQILNSWANTCTEIIGNSNKALGAGIYGYQFANAAEILRDYEGWTQTDFDLFKQWMVDVFYSVSYDFLETHYNTCSTHYWANWDLCNIATIMSIGILTDDVSMYSYAVDYLMEGIGNGQLLKTINNFHEPSENDDIVLGQIQESGRDQGHALLCIGFLGTIAQMAENQGQDIWSYNDNAILKGAEYEAKYNYAQLSVPFTTYTNCDDITHTEASETARGDIRPIWQIIYSHYITDEGMTARYVELAKDLHQPEGGGGNYSPNSGGYDALGFGTLLYTK